MSDSGLCFDWPHDFKQLESPVLHEIVNALQTPAFVIGQFSWYLSHTNFLFSASGKQIPLVFFY
jgi:hypothetical protein